MKFDAFFPQHLLSRLAGLLCNCKIRWWKNWQIRFFIRLYDVNLKEALLENIEDYPTFNSFFTRLLKPELRPIADHPKQIACPVDGSISQIGKINVDSLFQAKGFYFNLKNLLGGSEKLAKHFYDGHFATFYLAPRDYHRVHMPYAGKLLETIYVPGKLFSVNRRNTETIPNLFSRNERLITIFETDMGKMAVILVGAMLVGSIHTAWNTSPKSPPLISLKRGEELGYFKMGSTVILLFEKNKIAWDLILSENSSVKMGEKIGNELTP